MKRRLSRRTFLKLLGGGSLLGLTAGFGIYLDSYRFEVAYHQHRLAKLTKPLKLAQLSDLHFGRWIAERSLTRWVDATLAQKPDIIVITGDFFDYSLTDLAPLIRQLARLEAPLGVYGVLGNHDYDLGTNFLTRFKNELATTNVKLLINEGSSVRDDLFLAGTDDKWYGQLDLNKTLEARPAEQACLLLTHIPDSLPDIPQSVDLTLCGHTHGGQVKLPFYGAVISGSAYGNQFLEGWIDAPVKAFVSRGLGMVALPLRFLSRSELVIIQLLPVN